MKRVHTKSHIPFASTFLLVFALALAPKSGGFQVSFQSHLRFQAASTIQPRSTHVGTATSISKARFGIGRFGRALSTRAPALRLVIGEGGEESDLDANKTEAASEKSVWSGFPLPFVEKAKAGRGKTPETRGDRSRDTATGGKSGTVSKVDQPKDEASEEWTGFSFPPLQAKEAVDPSGAAPRAQAASSSNDTLVAGEADAEARPRFTFPKFEGAGPDDGYDILEVLKAPAKQAGESLAKQLEASEGFAFPFGEEKAKRSAAASARENTTETRLGSGDGEVIAGGKSGGLRRATAEAREKNAEEQSPDQMADLLKQIDRARLDLADAAMRLSNFEQDMARVREGVGSLGNSSGPTVTLTREGTDTIIRIDEAALGEGRKRKKMLSMINSALQGLRFPSAAVPSKLSPEDSEPAAAPKPEGGAAKEATRKEEERAARGSREEARAAEEEALLSDIMRRASLGFDEAASKAEAERLERRRIAKMRTLKGVSKVVRAWYGNPRDIMKLYNATSRLREQDGKSPAKAGAGQDWNFWEALWKTSDGDALPGKDVTESVQACLQLEEDGAEGGSEGAGGTLSMRDSLNDIFGDPAFGVNKVLVVEFVDAKADNMTAAWMETKSRPRMWQNAPPQTVVEEIASGVLEEGRREAIDDDPLLDLDSGGNSWIKKMLWMPDEQLRDEVWVDETVGEIAAEIAAERTSGQPPPPVIPFIKYASPGPPKSAWTEPDCNLPEFRVLSLDGGGVRGVLSAVILGRIVEAVPSFLDNVDLIAGTSTGGLIALMLAAGYTPRECQAIYEYGCPLIFAKDPWRVYNPLKAKFSPKGREDLCRTYLGEDRTLRDLQKHVVVTAFKLDGKVGPMGTFISNNGGWRPSVFSNIPKMDGVIEPELDMYCWDAALRTSAAPTYFPAHRGYVDGAMFANNPSMLAVTKACAHFPRVSPDNMVVLSLGAGNFPISIDAENQDMDWGIKDWVPFIFDLMMDGDSLSGELLLRYMLNSPQGDFTPEHRYHRIDPTLPQYVELDDVDVIPELIRLGQSVDLTDAIAFAQRHFSNTPSASDAFSLAAQRTATWAKEQATKVQLREVIESLAVMPSNGIPNVGTWPVWTPTDEAEDATTATRSTVYGAGERQEGGGSGPPEHGETKRH